MGSFRVAVGGVEIVIAPSDLLRIIENPSVFFNIFTSWAFLAASRSSLSSSGSLWELIIKLWEPPGAHLELIGASQTASGSFRELILVLF